ncbi:hypothetical protein CAP48_05455 [Advenella sp. S44]|nr:hypothetical protein CAP48_05455 [Advenella sp. S44]
MFLAFFCARLSGECDMHGMHLLWQDYNFAILLSGFFFVTEPGGKKTCIRVRSPANRSLNSGETL